jgi:hypothetical protein
LTRQKDVRGRDPERWDGGTIQREQKNPPKREAIPDSIQQRYKTFSSLRNASIPTTGFKLQITCT